MMIRRGCGSVVLIIFIAFVLIIIILPVIVVIIIVVVVLIIVILILVIIVLLRPIIVHFFILAEIAGLLLSNLEDRVKLVEIQSAQQVLQICLVLQALKRKVRHKLKSHLHEARVRL